MEKLENKFSIEQKNYLLFNFGKLTIPELSKKSNLSQQSIRTFFKNRNLKLDIKEKKYLLKRRKKQYFCNSNFFKNQNNTSTYWAGFIAADGCITNNRLQIKLKYTDNHHLLQFKNDINSNCKITKVQSKRNNIVSYGCLLYINDDIVLQDLKNLFNIVPKKSLTLQPPYNSDQNFIDSYIKGYFDGDGTVYKKKKYLCVRFYGTKSIMDWIKQRLDVLYKKNSGSIFKKENIYCFELNPKASTFFGNYYKNIKTPELTRKWIVFNNSEDNQENE